MKKITLIVLILTSTLFSAKYAGEFLLLNSDVRSLGMGSCGTAYSENVSGFLHNPANIANINDIKVATMYSTVYGDVFSPLAYYHYIGFAVPVYDDNTTIALNWVRFGVDEIPYFPAYSDVVRQMMIEQNNGQPGTSEGKYFEDREDAVFLTVAKKFDTVLDLGWEFFKLPIKVNTGLNVKFINIDIAGNQASGIGFDAGVGFNVDLNNMFSSKNVGIMRLGAVISDFNNTGISWSKDAEDAIPLRIKLGAEYPWELDVVNSVVTLAYSTTLEPEYNSNSKHYGVEWLYNDLVALRLGYDNENITAGTGVYFMNFSLDYAYKSTDLGDENKVGFSYKFKFDKLKL